MATKAVVDFEKELEQELKMLQGWADSIGVETRTMTPQIRDAVHAEEMRIPSCPARGSMGAMCLSGISQRADEIQAGLTRISNLLLSKDAPWNNRGDEKDWWKNS